MVKNWYVYRITFEDGKYYLGYRGTRKNPNQDFLIKYFSSSNDVKLKMKSTKFKGEILFIHQDQEIAYNTEQQLIYENISDKNIMNRVCYFGRKGFGVFTDVSRKKIGENSKKCWGKDSYREKMKARGAKRWTDEKREEQAKRLIGIKRPEHSKFLKGKPAHQKFIDFVKSPRKEVHKKNISKALTGKKKTNEHKANLSGPKKRICRLFDKKEMSINHFTRWVNSIDRASRGNH